MSPPGPEACRGTISGSGSRCRSCIVGAVASPGFHVSKSYACVPSMSFDQIQCADLAAWQGDPAAAGWKRVVASVAELLGDPMPVCKSEPTGWSPRSPRRSRAFPPFGSWTPALIPQHVICSMEASGAPGRACGSTCSCAMPRRASGSGPSGSTVRSRTPLPCRRTWQTQSCAVSKLRSWRASFAASGPVPSRA